MKYRILIETNEAGQIVALEQINIDPAGDHMIYHEEVDRSGEYCEILVPDGITSDALFDALVNVVDCQQEHAAKGNHNEHS